MIIPNDKNISFVNFQENVCISAFTDNIKTNSIALFDSSIHFDLMKFLTLNFTITTNSGSGKFSPDLLVNTSKTIFNIFAENDENDFHFHLDIDDETNVLGKFEQLYLGKLVFFTEDDLPVARIITKLLKITRCPNYLLPTLNYYDIDDPDYFNYYEFTDQPNNQEKLEG